MYGFGRADIRPKSGKQAFYNPLFLRGREDNLHLIKRNFKPQDEKGATNLIATKRAEVNTLLCEVQALKKKQDRFDAEVFDLKVCSLMLLGDSNVLTLMN